MSRHTNVGCAIWDWPRWVTLSVGGRNLWWALYTSPEVKRMPPGLWHGGVAALAEAARVDTAEGSTALDELLERGLAAHDPLARVIRLTELPDRGERAPNGRVVRSWWTRPDGLSSSPEMSLRAFSTSSSARCRRPPQVGRSIGG